MNSITVRNGFEIKKEVAVLNPVRSYYQVLGTLTKFPTLLVNPKMNLSEDDFLPDFHKAVFSAIRDIVCQDSQIKKITCANIDDYLSQFNELYEIWNLNDGIHYMKGAIKHANSSAFKVHYRNLKKHTVMRQFVNAGVDITKIFKHDEPDIQLFTQSKEEFDLLSFEEVSSQLIETGKGNVELQQQLQHKQDEIDTQIAMLMRQKQGLNDLMKKLAN